MEKYIFFVILIVSWFVLGNAHAEVAEVSNTTDQDCYVSVELKTGGGRNIHLKPGETTTLRYGIETDGQPDSVFCLSDFRAAGVCRSEVEKGKAYGCFFVTDEMGCGVTSSADAELSLCL